MKETFAEVIDFISTQSDYIIMGSFGLSFYVPDFPYSDDFDITLGNPEQLDSWQKHFTSTGWVETKRNQLKETVLIVTLQKEETNLDLILDPKTLKKFSVTEKEINGKLVRVMEAEGMCLRKLSAAFCHPERGEKRAWDMHGALELLKVLDQKSVEERFKELVL